MIDWRAMTDVVVSKLQPDDRAAWDALFEGYLTFYERTLDQAGYDRAWEAFQRNETMHALGARIDGGRGVGRALIVAVVEEARLRGCGRVYWLTHETNAVARALYDKVALNSGFIRYQIAL